MSTLCIIKMNIKWFTLFSIFNAVFSQFKSIFNKPFVAIYISV